jgi:diadenosine tetraphosphate (Ap4A) HIT family hydrolase
MVSLPGDWTLNHYGGHEGFLGWLALQPRDHCPEIADLSPRQAAGLGSNLRRINLALREYWSATFDDPIERVYTLYLHEGVFDARPSLYHVHFHIIPRSQRLDALLRSCGEIVAWDIYKVSRLAAFPPEYRRDEIGAEHLMNSLKTILATHFTRA